MELPTDSDCICTYMCALRKQLLTRYTKFVGKYKKDTRYKDKSKKVKIKRGDSSDAYSVQVCFRKQLRAQTAICI